MRPDPDAIRRESVSAITRATLSAARRCFDRTRSAEEIARRTLGDGARAADMGANLPKPGAPFSMI
jgi:hypothetical protein